MLVAYLWQEMWRLHASEICVTMTLKGLYIIKKQWKPYTSKNLTLGGENARIWAPLGNLVHQFPAVVTLAYYLCLTHMIHRYKYIFKEYILKWKISSPEWTHIFLTFDAKKALFRASKRLQKFRTRKLSKIVNCATIKENGKLKETMVGVQVE